MKDFTSHLLPDLLNNHRWAFFGLDSPSVQALQTWA
ncbi:hypothetical protein F0726_00403 [Acidithiobacillus caldus]|nr:hypothetical protein F0726_00403 [Acidithiobacillus caldus]